MARTVLEVVIDGHGTDEHTAGEIRGLRWFLLEQVQQQVAYWPQPDDEGEDEGEIVVDVEVKTSSNTCGSRNRGSSSWSHGDDME